MAFKTGADLKPGDVLVGAQGGHSTIYDSEESGLVFGTLAIETEHGHLYLDPENEYEVLDR